MVYTIEENRVTHCLWYTYAIYYPLVMYYIICHSSEGVRIGVTGFGCGKLYEMGIGEKGEEGNGQGRREGLLNGFGRV